MKAGLTKSEAQAFKKRWEAVNAAEQEELRMTDMATKLRQLAALMASVSELGRDEARASEEAEVRKRWKRLRRACGVL